MEENAAFLSGDRKIPESEMEKCGKPEFRFTVPSKQITGPDKVKVWEESQAYQDYLGFIMDIGDSIQGKKITDDVQVSKNCSKVVQLLEKLGQMVDATPPIAMQARYGNPAYRDWFDKLEGQAEDLLGSILVKNKPAVVELKGYLVDSFGNRTRIDYGTGHEKTFVMFVAALFKIQFLQDSDREAVGLKVFNAYFQLCRTLQTSYRMEPAGSMGVWNLDDYQFVAFILGAAQLVKGCRVKPKSISDPEMAEMLKKDFHLFSCLAYIHQVKSGPFHEHSNQLWNISAVQLWSKVYTGLIKMYRAEVLSKFPVVQHSLFGSVFSLEKATTTRDIPGNPGTQTATGHPGGPLGHPGLRDPLGHPGLPPPGQAPGLGRVLGHPGLLHGGLPGIPGGQPGIPLGHPGVPGGLGGASIPGHPGLAGIDSRVTGVPGLSGNSI